jgi:hypothetical protein
MKMETENLGKAKGEGIDRQDHIEFPNVVIGLERGGD